MFDVGGAVAHEKASIERMFGARKRRVRLVGLIAGCGFASGDRFVVGIWEDGPLGPMVDVMWADPSGHRVLLAPDQDVANFVGGVYSFEETRVVEIKLEESAADRVRLSAGPLELELLAGRSGRIFGLRPRWVSRSALWVRIEDSVLRPLVGRMVLRGAAGVRAYGTSASGVREWYCVEDYRRVEWGRASLLGKDLGDIAPLHPAVRFGFSEFPLLPALVRCAPLLEGAERFLPPPQKPGAA